MKFNSASDYWKTRKANDAARKAKGIRSYPGLSDAQKVNVIRAHVCGPECGPVCTKFDW